MTAYKNTLIFSVVSLVLLIVVFSAASIYGNTTEDNGLISVTVFGKEDTDSLLISCSGETIIICDDDKTDELISLLKQRNIKKTNRMILTRAGNISENDLANEISIESIEYTGQENTVCSVGKADVTVDKRGDDTLVSIKHGSNLTLFVFGNVPDGAVEYADFIYQRTDEADMYISDGKSAVLTGETSVVQSNGSYVRILKDISLL